MTPKRIQQRLADFEKALSRLELVLQEDPAKTDAIIDATIQRFEFTFELAWKLTRDVLLYNGIEVDHPRAVIKEAFQKKFFEEGDAWIQMLEDRNKTSHIYDEREALQIYDKIKKNYCHLLENLKVKISPMVKKMQ